MNAVLQRDIGDDERPDIVPDDGSHVFGDGGTFGLEMVMVLTEMLQAVAGREDAAGYIEIIAHKLGADLNTAVLRSEGVDRLDLGQICRLLLDLKARIGGGFSIESVNDRRIVLRNTNCPFGRRVAGRESLCNMTSGVFGRIVADNTGYARIVLDQTIARGDGQCRVIIDLESPHASAITDIPNAREYFGS